MGVIWDRSRYLCALKVLGTKYKVDVFVISPNYKILVFAKNEIALQKILQLAYEHMEEKNATIWNQQFKQIHTRVTMKQRYNWLI